MSDTDLQEFTLFFMYIVYCSYNPTHNGVTCRTCTVDIYQINTDDFKHKQEEEENSFLELTGD